jgi:acetyl esterase/lipase
MTKNIQLIALFLSAAISPTFSQEIVRLWPDSSGTEKDVPTLTMYVPIEENESGAAIIICPGGSYRGLAKHEGEDYALFLSSLGIRAFVLKYRLGPVYTYREITADATRAIRLVRSHAVRWKVDPARVGIMGSSAGGHLASTTMTHFDSGNQESVDPIERVSSRPDFGILCYPVISMGPMGHAISREQFLGPNPSQELIDFYSNELHVTPETPACFLWHTFEDSIVSVENSLAFARSLKAQKVPFALHVYERGRHGLGLGAPRPFENPHPWVRELVGWLFDRNLIR